MDFTKQLELAEMGFHQFLLGQKRRRDGLPAQEFKEMKVAEVVISGGPCNGVEMLWENGEVIRFQQLDQLIDVLKKVA